MTKEKSPLPSDPLQTTDFTQQEREHNVVVSFIRKLIKPKNDSNSLRDTIEEIVDSGFSNEDDKQITEHEKRLITNVIKIRHKTAADIMLPRADIVAISESASQEELFNLLAEKQYSRVPVYKETLDEIIGSIHAKDILATLARGEIIRMTDLVREVPVISPAMQILDLLLQMRLTRKHMVLVVDEFGGIDGLITIGDVIEAIVGELYDEHDPKDEAELVEKTDGTFIADARLTLDDFESQFGKILKDDEKQESDTLGGLVTYLAGKIPLQGEVFTHSSGVIFEILDADTRRINKLRIGNFPKA